MFPIPALGVDENKSISGKTVIHPKDGSCISDAYDALTHNLRENKSVELKILADFAKKGYCKEEPGG